MFNLNLGIITPIFPPATGGAATYYSILVDELCKRTDWRILLISERNEYEKRELPDNAEIIGLFPNRASSGRQGLMRWFLYLLQNIAYFALPLIVWLRKIDVLLVHSSFHNYPNTLWFVTKILKAQCVLISDVRDHQLNVKSVTQIDAYSLIFCCSENIKNHLIGAKPELEARICLTPVIQPQIVLPQVTYSDILDKYSLVSKKYFLCVGLVKALKGVSLVADVFSKLREMGYADWPLVFLGSVRDDGLAYRLSEQGPGVKFLGALPQAQTISLISQAGMVLNFSQSEGLPRACLESIELGVHCIFPLGVPEFERHLPNLVMTSRDADELAEQIHEALSLRPLYSGYPLCTHRPDQVANIYIDRIMALCLKV